MPLDRSPSMPEDWPRIFTEHLNAGDLEAVVALYDADARFVARSGETIVGRERIRDVLRGMIDTRTRLDCRLSSSTTGRSRSSAVSPTDLGSSSSATRTHAPTRLDDAIVAGRDNGAAARFVTDVLGLQRRCRSKLHPLFASPA
jgi:hypothetical protein